MLSGAPPPAGGIRANGTAGAPCVVPGSGQDPAPGRRWWRRPARSWGRSCRAPGLGVTDQFCRVRTSRVELISAAGILAPCPTSTRPCRRPRDSPSPCGRGGARACSTTSSSSVTSRSSQCSARASGRRAGEHPAVAVLRGPPRRKTHQVLVEHLSRGNSGWVPRASVVLLTATQVAPDPDGEGGGPHAAYDLGQAAAHITIQAASMGLHAHQFAGFDRAAVAARLGVPGHYAVLSGIAVGRRGARRGRRTGPRQGGPGPATPVARRVRVRRRVGIYVATRVTRKRRGVVLLVVLVFLINLPIVHSTITNWRVSSSGVDVTAEVTDARVTSPDDDPAVLARHPVLRGHRPRPDDLAGGGRPGDVRRRARGP